MCIPVSNWNMYISAMTCISQCINALLLYIWLVVVQYNTVSYYIDTAFRKYMFCIQLYIILDLQQNVLWTITHILMLRADNNVHCISIYPICHSFWRSSFHGSPTWHCLSPTACWVGVTNATSPGGKSHPCSLSQRYRNMGPSVRWRGIWRGE